MSRSCAAAMVIVLASATAAPGEKRLNESYDWDQWRHLPVLDGGRYKPLDTLAWEALRLVANRASARDPETQDRLKPTPLYVAMLLEWQGWQSPMDPHALAAALSHENYFEHHAPDKWDNAPIIRLDSQDLRRALGFEQDPETAETPKYVSPVRLGKATFTDPESGKKTPFLEWAAALHGDDDLSAMEENGREAAGRLAYYRLHRMGLRLNVIPISDDEEHPWLSVAELAHTQLTDETDPSGRLREAQEAFRQVRQTYSKGSPDEFNRASAAFIALAKRIGSKRSFYPKQSKIDLEVTYNHAVPFRWAWVLMLAAALSMLLSMATGFWPFHVGGWVAASGGVVAMGVGFIMRIGICGFVAVTNQYESVVFTALGAAVIGMVLEAIYRPKILLTVATVVAMIALILADNSPAVLDPEIGPLKPVLKSNFWLTTHVLTIMLGYAGLAVAFGIAEITLTCYLFNLGDRQRIASLGKFTYRALQFGVLLLAVGTILGAVWADRAWGRYWGWDPKEVWALIALLGYLAVLHARYIGWVRNLGLAVLSTLCFSLVMMAWFFVNLLQVGLHSYGFFGSQRHFWYIAGAMLLQTAYTALAGIVGKIRQQSPAQPAAEDVPYPGKIPTG
jgi:cytochrome c-type biogenesis protein CcsB